jgi:hypothetical protein
MITDKARTPVVMTVLILKRPNMTHPQGQDARRRVIAALL